MRMNRAKRGTVVLNKLYGSFYLITGNSKDESGKIISAEAVRIDEDSYLESVNAEYNASTKKEVFAEKVLSADSLSLPCMLDSITLKEANAICFRVIKDSDERLDAENWYVQNGILMKNGIQAAEQGEMEIEKILAIFPKIILLTVKSDKEGYVSLKFFDPAHAGREFRMVMGDKLIPTPEKVVLPDDGILLYYSRTHMEETGDGEEKTTEEVVDASGYIIYDSCGEWIDSDEYDIESSESHEINVPLGTYVVATEKFIVFNGTFNGSSFTNILRTNMHGKVELESVEMNSEKASVTEGYAGLLIKTEKELAVAALENLTLALKPSKQLSRVLTELQGYDYLVDFVHTVEYSGETKYFTLTLANDKYEVKKLKGSRTAALGLVLTVETVE